MKNQTLTKQAPLCYSNYGATYAEIIDWFSIRGYDIHFEHPFARPQRWTASVNYRLSDCSQCEIQIKEEGEFFYSDDWEEVANKAISLAISQMEENNELSIQIILP